MSVLVFDSLKGRTQRICDACPSSMTGSLRIARWKVTILGHPLGLYCHVCKASAQNAWNSALEHDLEADHDHAVADLAREAA